MSMWTLAVTVIGKMKGFFLLDRVTYYQSTIFNVYRGPSKYLHACNVAQDVYNGNFGPFANQIDSTTQAGGVCTDSYCGM